MTTFQIAFKKAGVKVRKARKSWPRAKYGTRGVSKVQGGIKNLHFTASA